MKLQDPLYDVVRFRRRIRLGGRAPPARSSRRSAGSNVWTRANIGQDVSTWLRALSFSDPQYGWLVGGYGLIYHTEDGGKSWLPVQG